ncbi:MAG: zf-TFIIB domain-containing protein [Myxococcota bacterium]
MRLVACPSCHTQYDVTDVVLEKIPCVCGVEIPNVDHDAVDATVHRCGSCGAIVAADAESCAYCGSAIVRDLGELSLICPECFARCAELARFCTACGVAFEPQPVRVEGQELPCPDCDALMEPHQVGGVGVNECRTCHGLWVPGDAFDLLLSRAVEARSKADPARQFSAAPRVTGANPASQGVRYRKCPECMAFMQRRNFRKSSGVIIDVCHQHGTWLDADELEQIAGFVLSGKTTSQVIIEEERKVVVESARWRREARMAEARMHGRVIDGHGGGTSLLKLFMDLLD